MPMWSMRGIIRRLPWPRVRAPPGAPPRRARQKGRRDRCAPHARARPRVRLRRAVGGGDHPLLEDRLDPELQLGAAARRELAGLLEVGAMPLDSGQQLADPLAAAGHGAQDGRQPGTRRLGVRPVMAVIAEGEHHLEIARHAVDPVAIGLVEHEDIGDLENPRLDRLDVVTQARHRDDENRVDAATTSTSSWPTPTVSTSTQSKPAASSRSTASRVARASPPIAPRVAIERMKTPGSVASPCMRMRSPSSAPPVKGVVGSTQRMPTVSSRRRQLRRQAVDQRALAGSRWPGDPDDARPAGRRIHRAEERRA